MSFSRIVFLLLIILLLPVEVFALRTDEDDNNVKTIIIITDSLDFRKTEALLKDKKASLGLMNIKTGNFYKNNSSESFFMTLASGERVNVDKGLFMGVEKKEDGRLYVKGFEDIIRNLRSKYKSFSQEINLFGQYFKHRNITVGYMGNDSSSLIAADKKGLIEHGETELVYERQWLISKTWELFNNVDILVISYLFDERKDRVEILKDYINEFKNSYIIIFPNKIDGDIDRLWNTALVPVIYNTPWDSEGILTAVTTRRRGVVTNLDILPTAAGYYGLNTHMFIGSSINVLNSTNPIREIKSYLLEFLNLNILKYLFHGVVIAFQLYIIISASIGKENNRVFRIIINGLVIGIFISFILGVLNIQRSIFWYTVCLLTVSAVLSIFLTDRVNVLGIFSLLTGITILSGIFINTDIIYNSYIGYNNIVAGGRFYGFNNEIVGVLLAAAVISFMYINKLVRSRAIKFMLFIPYFSCVLLSLSGGFGANIGGSLTAAAVLLMIMYGLLLKEKLNIKTLSILAVLGVTVPIISIIADLLSVQKSHGGSLIVRAVGIGYSEIVRMFLEKVRQFMFMIIIPPWSIILVGQLYYINIFIRKNRKKIEDIKEEHPELFKGCFILFTASVIILLTNDTGVISFTYMNTYLIGILIGLHNIEKRDLF